MSGYRPPVVGWAMRVTTVREGRASVSEPAAVGREVSTNVSVTTSTSNGATPSAAGRAIVSDAGSSPFDVPPHAASTTMAATSPSLHLTGPILPPARSTSVRSGSLRHGLHDPRRDAGDEDGGWDVFRDDRAGGHHGVVADRDALEDGGTGADL